MGSQLAHVVEESLLDDKRVRMSQDSHVFSPRAAPSVSRTGASLDPSRSGNDDEGTEESVFETARPFMLALAIGLLIGIERERAQADTPVHDPLGSRTFPLLALLGAVAAHMEQASVAVVLAGVEPVEQGREGHAHLVHGLHGPERERDVYDPASGRRARSDLIDAVGDLFDSVADIGNDCA